MYNSQYYTCEQIDQRLLQGYLDDYNSQNDTNLTKEQFLTLLFNTIGRNSTVDNIVTQIGYYECDTAAGTAAKAITVNNYNLFAGGSMKVRFVNKNTANNATLNINNQGAKALYYQGEIASSTNSWDEGEVVEIYYDGTSYYANNVKGGSGSGVYDVSKEHPTSGPNSDGKFTLEYILNPSNVNELIPVNKRYPGMSIQFVSTSDNKYVQYRLMSDSFNTTPSNWQGVDEVPTPGSHNLVESEGVYPLTRKYIILDFWGSDLPSITSLNDGDFFYSAYNKKIGLKTAPSGSAGYTEFPIEKNQLYLYKKKFFTSFDGENLTCISNVFDISEINASSGVLTEYDRLYSALIALPIMMRTNVQFVSFVNSVTHKYEHYRRISKDFSTNINNWSSLVVDNTIDKTSKNPISNSAVALGLENLENEIGEVVLGGTYNAGEVEQESITGFKFVDANGNLSNTDSSAFSVIKYDLSDVKAVKLRITASTNFSNPYYAFYSSSECSSETLVQLSSESHSGSTGSTEIFDVEIPINAAYLVINKYTNQGGKVNKLLRYIENLVKSTLTGKKWVCVGDSLTEENDKTTKHYFDFIREETGIVTVNFGVSGSGYARRSGENLAFYQRVLNIPSDADVVTIFGSFNDLGAGIDVGSVDDTGISTLAGCINTTISNIQSIIPTVRLGIIAPTPWQASQPTTSGGAYNYVEMLKNICERRSIPFLDLWRCSNLRPWDADFRALVYSNDPEGEATHPNEIGHSLIAPMFRQFILSLI